MWQTGKPVPGAPGPGVPAPKHNRIAAKQKVLGEIQQLAGGNRRHALRHRYGPKLPPAPPAPTHVEPDGDTDALGAPNPDGAMDPMSALATMDPEKLKALLGG